ncbi:hypothetical protein [Arenibaculum pallidiluteum]|uniref:hypothetical protein n=1 Tax=Arenibaculum pallidiluteum TaxID=2812559 RepID=UPI001A96CAA1|nr:hypothetical protein [Arenibaculum pallidiluteum]
MNDEMLDAFVALRDLVVRLQVEQVETLRTMQLAIAKLAEQAAAQEGRLELLQGQVEALLGALETQEPPHRMN